MREPPHASAGAALLADQIAYYRARAAEYDEWWVRAGRFDRGALLNAAWRADAAAVEAALDAYLVAARPRRALELACGTGLFTRRLAAVVADVVAVDASPEVIALNRARRTGATPAGRITYVESDVFAWRSAERFDLVFFSFWLSHVPPSRFASFWEQVRASLAPGGTVYLIDSAFDRTSTAKDHVLPGADAQIVTRRLNDGREFRIVKVFYKPGELNARLIALGWNPGITQTQRYFIHGTVRPEE